ncbi:MAG: GspH/FimT family pseudopilin [Hyphomonas sp.]
MTAALSPQAGDARAGFSLSEALVAVFLLALAAMVVVATLPARPAAGLAAAERLSRDFQDIRDRAILSGQVQAVRLREGGYEPLRWDNGNWLPAAPGHVQLDPGVTLALQETKPRSRFAAGTAPPEIVFDPTGIVAAPGLVVIWETGRLALTVRPDGAVIWDDDHV